MGTRKVDSKEVGLEVGLIFFNYFLKTEYLHYGYFRNGVEADISNLAKAQRDYTDFLVSHIPHGTKTILDVGCGSGKFASELINKGYVVECVSPGTILTEHAKKILGNKVTIHQCKFEDVKPGKKYDLILFSESFQYIPMNNSFTNALQALDTGGHIMIADFFQTDAEGKSPLGGGHNFRDFQDVVKKYNIKLITEQDITNETAPTLDIVNGMSMEVLLPISNLMSLLIYDRFPLVAKILRWKYKKKLDKLQNKHCKGERNAASFKKYKTYRFYLFQKI